ncbi:MAG TPA: Hsp20/alpha crystallin family protein [Ktedonobacteraceae bacterium]|nr:Hsp20/alpha crystallin family protein [Ktedonobacteraceae bacterium]
MANMTRYNPFNEMVSLRDAMDRLFEDSFIPRLNSFGRGMASNLYETTDGFVLQLPLSGAKPEDIDITIQQNTVNLKWTTQVRVPEGATTHWSSFTQEQHQQSFTLPAAINADQVEATYENGVLMLTLPKAEHARARQVKIQTKTPALAGQQW